MRTRECTQDIRDLQAAMPWLSLTDLYLCRISWGAGVESCERRQFDSGNQCRTDQVPAWRRGLYAPGEKLGNFEES